MAMTAKLQDSLAYPPRLMRAERAAAYLGMGVTLFLQLVADGKIAKPRRIRGVVAWDRLKLDAFVEDDEDDGTVVNTVDEILRRR